MAVGVANGQERLDCNIQIAVTEGASKAPRENDETELGGGEREGGRRERRVPRKGSRYNRGS